MKFLNWINRIFRGNEEFVESAPFWEEIIPPVKVKSVRIDKPTVYDIIDILNSKGDKFSYSFSMTGYTTLHVGNWDIKFESVTLTRGFTVTHASGREFHVEGDVTPLDNWFNKYLINSKKNVDESCISEFWNDFKIREDR